jgi:hypothetical protein
MVLSPAPQEQPFLLLPGILSLHLYGDINNKVKSESIACSVLKLQSSTCSQYFALFCVSVRKVVMLFGKFGRISNASVMYL